MYRLAVNKDFIAQHFLIGGDWGPENQKHSHHYRLEITLAGNKLDDHGYLVDIVKIKDHLEKLTAYYRDQTLNELPEFKDINPGIEHLARISYQSFYQYIHTPGISNLEVKVCEDDIAWASYQGE